MIFITPEISIDENELVFSFIRGSGPGGQNINKVSTAVQLRYDIIRSPSLPEDVKKRLLSQEGNRISENGVLVIEAKRYRTQSKNREDAMQRFSELVKAACQKPKVRKKTKPSVSSSAARVTEKKRHGALKKIRKYNPDEWE